jgi:hypothetical protein
MPANYAPPVRDYKPFEKPEPRALAKREKLKKEQKHERAVYAAVDARDRGRCVLTGVRANPYATTLLERLHHHHIVQRGSGQGPTETWNIVSVSAIVHALLHQNRLAVKGNADKKLTWTIKADAVVECFGRRAVPAGVRVVSDEAWPAFIKSQARARD